MAAEVARQEELEVEGSLAIFSQGQASVIEKSDHDMDAIFQMSETSGQRDQQHMETPYGSDDEEYDDIFMDVIEQENRMASQQHQSPLQSDSPAYMEEDHEMMDMD